MSRKIKDLTQPNERWYGVMISDRGTYVSTPRWGMNTADAIERAKDAARDFALAGDFIYNVFAVRGETRKEVCELYAADKELIPDHRL